MALLERQEVLARLEHNLELATNGSGHVILIRGEAGIGKTALVNEFVESVGDEAFILKGACDDLITARPLGPLWDMAPLEPTLLSTLEADDRPAAFREVLDLVRRTMKPTAVIIEDVHWADDATLDMVKFVGRRIDDTHGLLILTYRDGEVGGDHPLRVALGDLPYGNVDRIELEPLSAQAVRELATENQDAGAIWEITGGNPFFVSEALASSSAVVPLSIAEAVNARVRRLSSGAQALVELCSVSPGRIEVGVVEDILGDSVQEIAEVEAAGIMTISGDTASFRHELARQAVESQLQEIVRRRHHLRILEACELRGSPIARLAHHARGAE